MKGTRTYARLILSIALLIGTVCGADVGEPEKPATAKFAGVIRDLNTDKRVMTVEAIPVKKDFAIAPDCEVAGKDNPKGTLDDLAVGAQVTIVYQDVEGMLIAHRIELDGPGPELSSLGTLTKAKPFRRYSREFN